MNKIDWTKPIDTTTMINLTLIEAERLLQPEPPSYFEYHARRTLPGDKTLTEFRVALKRSYLVAELEHQVRRMTNKGITMVDTSRDELQDQKEFEQCHNYDVECWSCGNKIPVLAALPDEGDTWLCNNCW